MHGPLQMDTLAEDAVEREELGGTIDRSVTVENVGT
jgi:hypothetical protein